MRRAGCVGGCSWARLLGERLGAGYGLGCCPVPSLLGSAHVVVGDQGEVVTVVFVGIIFCQRRLEFFEASLGLRPLVSGAS